MTAAIVERDETAETHRDYYRLVRTVEITGRTVRATVHRDFYAEQSLAHVEMINDYGTWTHLADEPTVEWWYDTPHPRTDLTADTFLGKTAERLIRRAAAILAPPTTSAPALTPHLLDAISALLANAHGYDSQHRVDPDDITWATTHGNRLHIIQHDDGSVTFTQAHRDDCPFITTTGTQECDEDCYLPHAADQ
ncbi:hypothetical protein [Saccharothrix sp.]|uniref:hypothetical protein n=1 Tax=Saccharothrix sp. TaxID=1873460 RepID=UPI0028113195|nr:hypothetical protein [Saccharothrix sp.]